MIVVVENPQGRYYGGLVAAPVFARIMQESLRLMNVPLDKPLIPQIQSVGRLCRLLFRDLSMLSDATWMTQPFQGFLR
jgi:hypothetical protein